MSRPLNPPGVYVLSARFLGEMAMVYRISDDGYVAECRMVREDEIDLTMAEIEEKAYLERRGPMLVSEASPSSGQSVPAASHLGVVLRRLPEDAPLSFRDLLRLTG